MFNFRRATLFCLGGRFSNHKTTRYAKNFEGPWPLGTPSYAYVAKRSEKGVFLLVLVVCHYHSSLITPSLVFHNVLVTQQCQELVVAVVPINITWCQNKHIVVSLSNLPIKLNCKDVAKSPPSLVARQTYIPSVSRPALGIWRILLFCISW